MTLQTAEAVICFPVIVIIIEMFVRALMNVDFGLFPTLSTSWGSCTSGLGSVYKTMVAHVGNGKLFFDHIGYPVKIVMIEKICRFEYRTLLESQLTNIEDNEDEQ